MTPFYLVFLCIFIYLSVCWGQLNLSEGSPCTLPNKVYNGTCVSLYKCGSAVLSYLYLNAGFSDKQLPILPDICSKKDDLPVVCCSDCVLNEKDEFKDSAIAPYGILVSRTGPLAWQKCLDYFHKLPYPCRGKGQVLLARNWSEKEECHHIDLKVSVEVGGRNPELWKFPHLALLGYGDDQSSAQWLCEGTVISERFILTAAHCTNAGVFGNVAYIAVGVHDRVPNENWKIYKVHRLIIHPEFNDPSWYNDIALLETDSEIRFDNDTLPACVDVGYNDDPEAEAAGIPNKMGNDTQKDDLLQTVYLNKLSPLECAEAYKPNNNMIHGFDSSSQLCYGTVDESVDTCKRIGGSPLQLAQLRCQYTVIGVTAQATECGNPNKPDLYTSVRRYRRWIESTVWPDEYVEPKRRFFGF